MPVPFELDELQKAVPTIQKAIKDLKSRISSLDRTVSKTIERQARCEKQVKLATEKLQEIGVGNLVNIDDYKALVHLLETNIDLVNFCKFQVSKYTNDKKGLENTILANEAELSRVEAELVQWNVILEFKR